MLFASARNDSLEVSKLNLDKFGRDSEKSTENFEESQEEKESDQERSLVEAVAQLLRALL